MSKRIHLLCNAHIDPVWQWEWEEGAAETLSTFRVAADLCEEFDDFIFCHNEALLYRWIEEYDPALFTRIQALVHAGKWNIMGGWHLQPDCNLPSGEGFVRQIFRGRQYFLEKFGKVPTTAIGLDAFGHTRGLVQIMAKSGYDSYLFVRPWPSFQTLPADDFRWIGYDGSSVIATRIQEGYSSFKGRAMEKIRRFEDRCPEDDFLLCLWGVGNHGGGPSKADLEAITAHLKDLPEGVDVFHSTPEAYYADVKARRELPEVTRDLNPWAPGCYTTMALMKQKYRQAENTLLMTERMCAHAAALGLMTYPQREIQEAVYDILTIQFHDTLPGSSIQAAEDMALRMLDHGLEQLSRVRARAFFALCAGQAKADPDAIPILIYNPFPYPLEGDFACEFMLWDQNWQEEFQMPTVFCGSTALPTQCEKEASSIPLEWRKRVLFHTTLQPMSMNRFDCRFTPIPCRPALVMPETDFHLVFDNGSEHVEINRQTGLIDVYRKDGQEILSRNAFRLDVFADDYDPWAMNVRGWDRIIGSFTLLSASETAAFLCTDRAVEPVHVIEQGDVRTVVEAVFGYGGSYAVVHYLFSKTGGMELTIRVQWQEKQKLLKLRVPAAFAPTQCLGEQAYGLDVLRPGPGEENAAQKFVLADSPGAAFALCNNGTYGVSFDDRNGILYPTLLRSPSYCAHPVNDRRVLPGDRYCPHTEQGERIFRFAFLAGSSAAVRAKAPRLAQTFNEGTFSLSFYPTGTGSLPAPGLSMDGSDVIQLTAFKQAEVGDGYILRLFNPSDTVRQAQLSGFGAKLQISLNPWEFQTFRLTDGQFQTDNLMEGLLK